MHLVVVIQLIEVIDKFLVVFHSQLAFHFLHVLDVFFVTTELLFHFLNHFILSRISLFYVCVPSKEFFRLVLHICMQFL